MTSARAPLGAADDMPDFVMPDGSTLETEAERPALSHLPQHATAPGARHEASTVPQEPLDGKRGSTPVAASVGRRRVPSSVLIAGAIGVLAGLGVATAVAGVEDAALVDAEDTVVTLVDEYLGALAEGRASDALALVPEEGSHPLLTDDAFGSADALRAPHAQLESLSSSLARVSVQYSVGEQRVERDVFVERDPFRALVGAGPGGWHITTPLTERLQPPPALADLPLAIGGVPLGEGQLVLPGVYTLDPVGTAAFEWTGAPTPVDGLRTTEAYAWVAPTMTSQLTQGLGEAAQTAVVACVEGGDCEGPAPQPAAFDGISIDLSGVGSEPDITTLRFTLRSTPSGAGERSVAVDIAVEFDPASDMPLSAECSVDGHEPAPCPLTLE